jgi:acyl-CoA reductase-like NAD-dependent aldehyde dehydrogenase
MEKYTLLVEGKDLDTGIYEYFPYADKVISNFKATFRALTQLKIGKLQEDSEEAKEYIYAKYCIGKEDTNLRAIETARKASHDFLNTSLSIRRKILGDINKNLIEKKEQLLNILIYEGHPRKLAEWELDCMERGYRKETLDFFEGEMWKEIYREGEETVYLARKTDGVICVSPPKNAPCSNSLTAAYCLLGGNSLIIKPPLRMPLSTIFLWKEIVWEAIKNNRCPLGLINIVLGNSKKLTDEWLVSPYVNDIIYFGDSKTGLEIGQRIFQAGKKPILELSGNDMLLIWKDADLEGAADSLVDAFLGSTQICMVPKKALLHGNAYEDFIRGFLTKVKELKIGLPSDPHTCLTPVLLMDTYKEFLNDALEKGAKLVYGGERLDYRGNKDETGVFLQPTVLVIDDYQKAAQMRCLKEENFFPLLPLVIFKGSDEEIFTNMVNMVNFNEYGLRTSLWINSSIFVEKFTASLNNSGLLRINSRHVGFSPKLSTHGGTRKTGGPYGEMNYMWQKTTHLQGISITQKKSSRR